MTRGRRFFTYSFRVDVRDDPRPKVHGRASPATGVGVPQPELGPRPWNAASLSRFLTKGRRRGIPEEKTPMTPRARRPVAIGMKTATFVSAGISQTRPVGSDSKAFTLNGFAPALPADKEPLLGPGKRPAAVAHHRFQRPLLVISG